VPSLTGTGNQCLAALDQQVRVSPLANSASGEWARRPYVQGEHNQIVVFWKIVRIAYDAEVGPEVENFEVTKSFVLRYYRVWNLEQCELPKVVHDRLTKIETHQRDPIGAAERIIVEMPNPPELQHAGA
jgi:hypothetical protein